MVTTELDLPWEEGSEDRLFTRLVIVLIIIFLVIGTVFNNMPVPDIKKKQQAVVPPRLAKLILEKKKVPPPPLLEKVMKKEKPIKKKEQLKPEVKKKKPKAEIKAKPKPKPKPKPVDTRAAAKKIAQKSGLNALSDEITDLRDSFDFSDIAQQPQLKTGKQALNVISTDEILSAKASRGSGGIKTSTKNRQIKGSKLAQRKTSQVKSNIQTSAKTGAKTSSKKSGNTIRTQEEIERVFQKNKGAIFSIYNRELRKDPSLQGKVVIELTISANGTVTKCVIISSELGNKKLEKRLVSKIKKFKFSSKNVSVFIVRYPIDFLPS